MKDLFGAFSTKLVLDKGPKLEKGFKVKIDESVVSQIFELNSQEEYGARPIKRIIQNLCEDFLSEEILKGNIKENVKCYLKYKDENLVISKKS